MSLTTLHVHETEVLTSQHTAVCKHFPFPSPVWLCCLAKKYLLTPCLSVNHRDQEKKICILRAGRKGGSCLISVSRSIYFQHDWILSPPWGMYALPTPHRWATQSVSRDGFQSASSLLTVPWFPSGPSGVQPCSDGNRIGRTLMACRKHFFFLHWGTCTSFNRSLPGQISPWLCLDTGNRAEFSLM